MQGPGNPLPGRVVTMQAARPDAPEEELLRVPETQVLHGPERVFATGARHKHFHPELERLQRQQSQFGCAEWTVLLCTCFAQWHVEQECAQQRNAD